MGIDIKYVCDRCKHSQDTDEQMWWVSLHINNKMHTGSYGAAAKPEHSKLWCRKCTDHFHLTPQPLEKRDLTIPPTFEIVLENLISDMVANALDNQ